MLVRKVRLTIAAMTHTDPTCRKGQPGAAQGSEAVLHLCQHQLLK
jgi:hypothetical protein